MKKRCDIACGCAADYFENGGEAPKSGEHAQALAASHITSNGLDVDVTELARELVRFSRGV